MTQSLTRGFLVWNLLLGWFPVICVYLTQRYHSLRYVYIVLWFLFLPNAFYLVTDLKHLTTAVSFSVYWLDIIILFSIACIGMILGVTALYEMKKHLTIICKKKYSQLIVAAALILSGYGIYLGRFPRLNSWHIFTNPLVSIRTISETTKGILYRPEQLFFIVLFTISFAIFYYGYKKINDHYSK